MNDPIVNALPDLLQTPGALSPEFLSGKTRDQLRTIATGLGMGYHHREKEATLANRIIEVSQTMQPRANPLNPSVQTPIYKVPPVMLMQDQVMAAIKPRLDQGMQARFSHDSSSWQFKFGDKEDSGTMTQPLETIVRCAEFLCRQSG